jgi:hypothetical protein
MREVNAKVRVASNTDLTTPRTGAIVGVYLFPGDVVFYAGQTNSDQNGPYTLDSDRIPQRTWPSVDVGDVININMGGYAGNSYQFEGSGWGLVGGTGANFPGLGTTTGTAYDGGSGAAQKIITDQSHKSCKYQLLPQAIAAFNPAATSAADWDGAVAGAAWTADAAAHVRLLNQATGVIYTLTTTTTCTATGETASHGAQLVVTDSTNGPTYRDTAVTGAAIALVRGPDTTYPLAVDTAALADGDVNIAYTQTVTASGGIAPYTYAVVGSLPAGLTLTGATISGTPTTAQSASFTIVATDAQGATASRAFAPRIWDYSEKIVALFGASLISYKPLSEPSGVVARERGPLGVVGDGSHTNVTLARSGIGDGLTAAQYTGSPISSTNAYNATESAKYDLNHVTMMIWAKPTASGFWTSGNSELLAQLINDGATKSTQLYHQGNGAIAAQVSGIASVAIKAGLSGTAWSHYAMTGGNAAGVGVSIFFNGEWVVTEAGTGTWTGTLGYDVIGNAYIRAANNAFPGYLAHRALINRAATKWEIQQCARVQTSGVWTPRCAVIEPSDVAKCGAVVAEPSVIYDTTDSLYKMLYSAGDVVNIESIALATSPTGLPGTWTNYAGNPVITGKTRSSKPVKIGGLWYMTCQVGLGTALALLSTPDFITWTTVNAAAIAPTATEVAMYNSQLVYSGGNLYLFYDYQTTDPTYYYATSVAISTDLINFTRSANNPIVTHASSIGAAGTAGGPCVHKHGSNGKWYMWLQCALINVPTDIVRFESTDPDGPWAQSTTGISFPRHSPETGWFYGYGQVADASIVEGPEGTSLFYSVVHTASAQQEIHVATSTLTLDQICETQEGIVFGYKPQMIINGSFETVGAGGTGFDGWTSNASNGAIARTTTAGEFHADSCKLAAVKLTAGAALATVVVQQITGLVPGAEYEFSGWGRGDGTHAGRLLVQSSESGNADLIPPATSLTTASATYAPFSFHFIAPGSGAVGLNCMCPATTGGIAYFDDLSVKQL